MLLTRLLNACHRFPGFVYEGAWLNEITKTIEVDVRPRRGSKPRCSGCCKPARGYDQLPERRFEFIPIWGFAVVLLYRMRRVQCRACGVKVEEVPWGIGKHTLTRVYMLYLAHWARKLSWQETAQSFHTSWEKVCQAGVVEGLYDYDDGRVIRTSAPFDFGSSGGGLFDEAGNLVGFLAFKGRTGERLRFALPVDWILPGSPVASTFKAVTPTSNPFAFWEQPKANQPSFLGVSILEAAGHR